MIYGEWKVEKNDSIAQIIQQFHNQLLEISVLIIPSQYKPSNIRQLLSAIS